MPRQLPGTLPIFPLAGALLLPRGRLPLHIFEPRYVEMVDDCLVSDRMIGMVQPIDGKAHAGSHDEAPVVYSTGCAGRITSFSDNEDGHYLITLTGVSRFRIQREHPSQGSYRRVEPEWRGFADDLREDGAEPHFDRSRLLVALPGYLDNYEITADWQTIESAPDERLVTSLAMVCPFRPSEKQALLEIPTLAERAEMLTALIEMAVIRGGDGGRYTCH